MITAHPNKYSYPIITGRNESQRRQEVRNDWSNPSAHRILKVVCIIHLMVSLLYLIELATVVGVHCNSTLGVILLAILYMLSGICGSHVVLVGKGSEDSNSVTTLCLFASCNAIVGVIGLLVLITTSPKWCDKTDEIEIATIAGNVLISSVSITLSALKIYRQRSSLRYRRFQSQIHRTEGGTSTSL